MSAAKPSAAVSLKRRSSVFVGSTVFAVFSGILWRIE